MLHRILRILINRYFIATLAFLVWIVFFDNYSMIRQYKMEKELNGLLEMKHHYRIQIEQNRKELTELVTDKETLEKFAREKYLMKRDNEDVYVVVKK